MSSNLSPPTLLVPKLLAPTSLVPKLLEMRITALQKLSLPSLLTLYLCVLSIDQVTAQTTQSVPDRRSVPTPTMIPADQQCKQDRRCRINRLKKLNKARRFSMLKGADFQALKYMTKARSNSQSQLPRLRNNIGLNLIYTAILPGVEATYQWTPYLQAGLNFLIGAYDSEVNFINRFVYLESIEENLKGYGLHVRYFSPLSWLKKLNVSPYVGAQIQYITGSAMVIDSNIPASGATNQVIGVIRGVIGSNLGGGSGGSDSNIGELELHLVGISTGLDYQGLSYGLHLRLGLTSYYPLYVGHKSSIDRSNLSTKISAEDWIKDELFLTLDCALGWAF